MLWNEAALIFLLTAAAWIDVHQGIVPNALTYPSCAFALSLALFQGGVSGFGASLLGLVVGFVPFFVLYLMGGLGGGDVKLMAGVGALMGYPFVVSTILSSILIGGVMALLIVIWDGKLINALRFLAITLLRLIWPSFERETLQTQKQLPFAVAICLGGFVSLAAVWSGHVSPAEMLIAWI